jgi:cell fate regulator YaaT (PSP1 superfamily)
MAKYVVRYGVMRALGVMSARENMSFSRGVQVIARTDRGLEAAIVLCEATPEAVAHLKNPSQGQVLREMTPADSLELSRILARQRDEFGTCQRHVSQLGLPMQLIDVEHIFGGERVVVYYLAENRVDFRELVKALAGEFQTRIEMRQIGSRDEAKLLADYGDCGKPVCCNTHLSEMPPVSMKMAKLQKATLDPTKISGRCGRLKCCLRYEYETYEQLQKDLPPVGSDIITSRGRSRVLAHEILAQQLLVETEDHRRVLVPAGEVLTVLSRGMEPREAADERNDEGI